MSITDFLGNYGTDIGNVAGTAAQLAGQQKASEAITSANTTAANTQKDYLGTAGGYYQPYLGLGSKSATQLEGALGENGKFDPSAITNNPAYQFAVQQGTQAGERQAAAMGNAGNSGTGAMIGNQVAGTASQFYQNYIDNLQKAAGIGQTSANQIGNLTYNTGANISQLAANSGQAEAGLYAGAGQTIAGAFNGGYGPGSGYGPNGSGSGSGNGLVGALGNIYSGVKGIFGGGGESFNPDGSINYGSAGNGGGYWSGPSSNDTAGYDPSSGFQNFSVDPNADYSDFASGN
jgi:hypothetical protein